MPKLMLLVATLFAGLGYAAVDTIEEPIRSYAAPESITVSATAYTNVTSTTTRALKNLVGVLVDIPSTQSDTFHGHVGSCTGTSVSTSTVLGPIEIAPASGGGFIGIGQSDCVWLVSRGSAGEITIQGVGQRK